MSNETLYHYCSAETFASIINNKSIWLSSLSLSNDTEEGKLLLNVLREMARQDNQSSSVVRRLIKSSEDMLSEIDGLGLCLSKEGDLLSQWRGYAADGAGLSIGFNRSYLEKMCKSSLDQTTTLFLADVLYDKKEQVASIRKGYDKLKSIISAGGFSASRISSSIEETEEDYVDRQTTLQKKIDGQLEDVLSYCFDFKSAAFAEEKEVRLLTLSTFASKKPNYRGAKDRIVPYINIPFQNSFKNIIDRVYLGPKHLTPTTVVASFLSSQGFGEIEVLRSFATYR